MAARDLPRDSFDVQGVIDQVGRDPIKLFEWVRDNTSWVPYRGALRGPAGVLMDRLGNSLDRALLLAETLRLAGRETRLARGPIDEGKAAHLYAAISQASRLRQEAPREAAPEPDLRSIARELGVDEAAALERSAAALLEGQRAAEDLEAEIAERSAALLAAVPVPPEEAAAPRGADLEALRDHWWVQVRNGAAWIDLDPLPPGAGPGEAAAAVAATVPVDKLGTEHLHSVGIAIVVERCDAERRSEGIALEATLRPAQVIDQRIALTCIPVNWPAQYESTANEPAHAALRKDASAVKEWLPVLEIGRLQIAQSSFTDTGEIQPKPVLDGAAAAGRRVARAAGGLEGALGGEEAEGEKKPAQLSAVWLELELRSPGRPPEKIRRELLDLLGPAARAAGKHELAGAPEAVQLERGLALLAQVEILPQMCDMDSEFVIHRIARVLLEKREVLVQLARLETRRTADDFEPAVHAFASLPGPLHHVALARRGGERLRRESFLARPNVLCHFTRLRPEGEERVVERQLIDIVNNDVSVRPSATQSPFRVRLLQGLVDSAAETGVLPPGQHVENAALVFARAAGEGKVLLTIRQKGDSAWQKLAAEEDARSRIEEDLRAGYVVVVPEGPVNLNGRQRLGWWRIHSLTGENLAITESGFHGNESEYSTTTYVPNIFIRVARRGQRGFMAAYSSLLRNTLALMRWTINETRLIVNSRGSIRGGIDSAAHEFVRLRFRIESALREMQGLNFPLP